MTYTTYYSNPAGIAKRPCSYTPSVNVEDRKDSYLVTAELPGISREDLEIEVKENVLTLSHTAPKEETEEKKYLMRERRSGREFKRSFILPKDSDRDKIEAALENGILRLSIAKVPAVQPRKISVKAS